MGKGMGAGACALAVTMVIAPLAEARTPCAKPDEVTAIQAASIQQQLMVAALTCSQVANFNSFQTSFGKELRAADGRLMKMFHRFYGSRRGEAEYHAFKTRIANDSSIRSIHDNPTYCAAAQTVFTAALVPVKPTLANFVSGIQIMEADPYDSCQISVVASVPKAGAATAAGTDTSLIWKRQFGAPGPGPKVPVPGAVPANIGPGMNSAAGTAPAAGATTTASATAAPVALPSTSTVPKSK